MKKTKTLTFCALVTAILCAVCPFSIPLGTSTFTLSYFVIVLCAVVFGSKITTIATLCYLVIGFLGLPVFSNFVGGVIALASYNAGFLLSYPIVAFVSGVKTNHPFLWCLMSFVVAYTLGSAYMMCILNVPFISALGAAVITYLPVDILKAFLATALGKQIRKRLVKTKLLDY